MTAHKQEEKEETAEEVVLQPAAATSAPEDVAADSNTKDIPQLPLLPTLEAAAQDSGQDPLEVFRPQATERGGAEGVVNTGGDLINFDSVTPSAAAAASQVSICYHAVIQQPVNNDVTHIFQIWCLHVV